MMTAWKDSPRKWLFINLNTKEMAKKVLKSDDVTTEDVRKWKAQFGSVFKYETEDGKVAYFRTPDRKILGLSTSAPDTVAGNEMVAKNCFLAGDDAIITEDKYFFGLQKKMAQLVKVASGNLEEL